MSASLPKARSTPGAGRAPAGRDSRRSPRPLSRSTHAVLGPGVRCLELGCGSGEFTSRLVESGCELAAVDISEASVALCRERVGDSRRGRGRQHRDGRRSRGSRVRRGRRRQRAPPRRGRRLPERDRSPDPSRTAGFAFSEPNRANPQVWAERRFEPLRRARHVLPHETAFRAGELKTIFERARVRRRCG